MKQNILYFASHKHPGLKTILIKAKSHTKYEHNSKPKFEL